MELKPCPFCGGEAKLIKKSYLEWSGCGPYDFSVYCSSCGAAVRRYFPKESEAIEAWNRRVGEGEMA